MKFAYIFFGLAAVLAISVSLPVWLKPPNQEYVKDLFDHSQWRYPLSTRIISDEQLYQHAGYYIVTTGDLFTVNPEVPPLGKYLYGFSQVYGGNPYVVTPLFLLVGLLAYYFIARQLDLSKVTSIWLVGVLTVSPLVFSQLTQTMLDLPHLVWLLLHILFLLKLKHQKPNWRQIAFAVLAGVFLGAFAATKVPLLVPLALISATLYIWRTKQIKMILPLGLATGISYLVMYIPYFLAGHTLIEWLGTQKWMLEFYRQSQVQAHPFLFPISIMSGWYKGWWAQPWQRIDEWSILWPISFVAPFWFCWLTLKRKMKPSVEYQYLLLLTFLFILIHFLIPFWPRYYLLIMPLCLLFWPSILETHRLRFRPAIQMIGVFGLLISAILFSRPSPQATLNFAVERWERGHYQDLYQSLLPSSTSLTAEEFYRDLKEVEGVLGKPFVNVSAPPTWPWQTTVPIDVTLTYQTEIGQLTHQKTLLAHRAGRNWHLDWDWEVVAPDYHQADTIIFSPQYPKLGTLSSADGAIISTNGQIKTVSVIPMLLQAKPTLDRISSATGLGFNELVAEVYVDAVGDQPVLIADLTQVPSETISEFSAEPGVVIQTKPGRVLHPQLSSQAERAWAWSIIEELPELDGKLGGKILLMKNNQTPLILLEVPAVPGQDRVTSEVLPPTFNHQ